MVCRFWFILIMLLCFIPVLGQELEQPLKKSDLSSEKSTSIGNFGDGTPLTQETLDELLLKHGKWLGTLSEAIIEKELDKAQLKEEQYIERLWQLLDSDWGVDRGRLDLRGYGDRKRGSRCHAER